MLMDQKWEVPSVRCLLPTAAVMRGSMLSTVPAAMSRFSAEIGYGHAESESGSTKCAGQERKRGKRKPYDKTDQ